MNEFVRRIGFAALTLSFLLGLTSCKSRSSAKNTYTDPTATGSLVDGKYSLQADRDRFAEMRKQIPPEVKVQNDAAAFIPQLFSDPKRSPVEIRRDFDQEVRKRRELFDRDLKKQRETFTSNNKRLRDDFLKNQEKQRTAFQKNKNSRDETSNFFADQDTLRKSFFADERERTEDFESQVREKRRNFDDYSRAKLNEFNEEMRSFTKRHEEVIKGD